MDKKDRNPKIKRRIVSNDSDSDSDNVNNKKVKHVKKYGYDYYKILGIEKTASMSEIKKKYRKLLGKYHPDKLNQLSDKKRNEATQKYKLIRIAGDVLSNIEKRKHYDLEQKVIKSKDFVSQKKSFEEFMELQNSEISDASRKRAELDFFKGQEDINKKMGFNSEEAKKAISIADANKSFEMLKQQREMEELEAMKPNLFADRQFSNSEFNKLFEKEKKRNEKKEQKKRGSGMVRYDPGFTAYNNMGNNFVSVEEDYNNLFGSNNFIGNNMCGKVDSDYSSLDDSDVSSDEYNDEYDNHNKEVTATDFNKQLEQMMKMREEDDKLFKNMRHDDFSSAMNDEFGVSKDFGVMLGKDITNRRNTKLLDNKAIKNYDKLIGIDTESETDSESD